MEGVNRQSYQHGSSVVSVPYKLTNHRKKQYVGGTVLGFCIKTRIP
jgi:hypothetical protein